MTKTQTLDPATIRILREEQERIGKRHATFQMRRWEDAINSMRQPCGTAFCIYGSIGPRHGIPIAYNFAERINAFLKLDWHQGVRLSVVHYWSPRARELWDAATATEEKAWAAQVNIEEFIGNNGGPWRKENYGGNQNAA